MKGENKLERGCPSSMLCFCLALEKNYFSPPQSFVHYDTFSPNLKPQKRALKKDSPLADSNCPWHSGTKFSPACTEDWAKMIVYSPRLGLRGKANKKSYQLHHFLQQRSFMPVNNFWGAKSLCLHSSWETWCLKSSYSFFLHSYLFFSIVIQLL